MLTEKQAKITWATKRKALLESCNSGFACAPGVEASNEERQLENELERFGRYVYSIPHLRHIIAPWMVDVKFGCEIPFREKKCVEEPEEVDEKLIELLLQDPQKFTEQTSNGAVTQVSQDLTMMGYEITDRGFGMGGGHIGCPCTDEQKDKLINFVWMKYRKAIDSGLLFPCVAWFKPTIRGLMNIGDIEKFLSEA
jgi:hypothetical protein